MNTGSGVICLKIDWFAKSSVVSALSSSRLGPDNYESSQLFYSDTVLSNVYVALYSRE